jgi:hypothetical protein
MVLVSLKPLSLKLFYLLQRSNLSPAKGRKILSVLKFTLRIFPVCVGAMCKFWNIDDMLKWLLEGGLYSGSVCIPNILCAPELYSDPFLTFHWLVYASGSALCDTGTP